MTHPYNKNIYPGKIFHWMNDSETESATKQYFQKYYPGNGDLLAEVTRGDKNDINQAIELAKEAYKKWSQTPVVKRSEIIREAVLLMREKKQELAEIVALECGKSKKHALGEVDAAIECGFFFAGEGRRYFGEVLTSAVPNRHVEIIRQSIGVGALITPFNNPAAGVAWKLFPALVCGNAVIIKSHEDTPYVAIWYAKIFKEAGLPAGVISVLQGLGDEVGAPLVSDERVKFVSFTGSVTTGQKILKATAERLAKVSIEAGGKNPFVVCDDADIEKAVSLAVQSAFVDAGQRCAAASRIIIFNEVYDDFKKKFLEKVYTLKAGTSDEDDYGAIINGKRTNQILEAVRKAVKNGAKNLVDADNENFIIDEKYHGGYFLNPVVLENVFVDDEISQNEIFGPVVNLYRVKNLEEAIRLANRSKFKLSSAIHTKNIDRAQEFIERYEGGVVRVNGPTHGSEPHMPFGGTGLSGNGWREPGTKALDFYSDWKQVSIDYDPEKI
ncbi:MAG: aldehyde dehydrogenase (NAD+) [Parcubacteria group bacterium Athens0714_26]|nr:MAG: aldehyde dehydrogenase (NAD+) [Parcubacteria group bacterium Athens1014_26]TSD01478.1 MAG: aldehyde dehydrogenase (NAD+) [Parcubacteria group bacterium Athens0714_26]